MDFKEKFIDREIAQLCEEYDKIKGANTNLARIAPDFIDGLKPVQRRALFCMFQDEMGKELRKLASISGDTFGKYHPHAPTSIEDAITGIEQPWVNSIPLITGEGNWGSVSGDPRGASRYISCKLSDYAFDCFFSDWKYSVVDMVPSYDGKRKEPVYLPAKYPNILLNGCLGIGYGMSCNMPPFNFREVVEAAILLMNDPDANIILIPDSPTGCDIIEGDFNKLCDKCSSTYWMRCKYEIDAETNSITIVSLPYMVTANSICEKIADIKEKNGLSELIGMSDKSGKNVEIILHIRDDVNPYKFMKKLIKQVSGLEKSYPVNLTVINDYEAIDYSVKELIMSWLKWRREQKRIVISHKRTSLMADQRINDVKIFIMDGDNLEKTINIFKEGRNRAEVEKRLIEMYKDTEIRMNSLQARTISNMRFVDLNKEEYEKCLKRREEILVDLKEVDGILNAPNGIDTLIVAELRDGIKKFGTPRRSNVVPYNISTSSDVHGFCILQLSSDGMITRKISSNVDEEPIPIDNNGFAVRVDNDSSFILIDENGYHSFIKVNDLPVDSEVPVNRYSKQKISGNIVAMLPVDIESDRCCTLISKMGMLKRIRIADMGPSKKPCIDLPDGDKIVRGIVTLTRSQKDILIYTKEGMGQRIDPNSIRITSPLAKGGNGFKLKDDEIVGCYMINPEDNQYLLYITTKGKMRLNNIDFLPTRDSKHDAMLSLISLNDRDRLLSIVGCNKLDKLQVFFDNGTSEVIDISKMEESTMGSEPKKMTTTQNAVTTNIVKVKLL